MSKYPTPALGFFVEQIMIPILVLDVPEHLKESKPLHRWLLNICPNESTGCWHWMGYTDIDGYGKFCHKAGGERVDARAHRFGYEALIAEVPEGLVLDHLCRVRDCVNPWHLEPVTSEENTRRGRHDHRGSVQKAKTHCPRGHEYDGWNLMVYKSGSRACRKCCYRRIRDYKQRARRAG